MRVRFLLFALVAVVSILVGFVFFDPADSTRIYVFCAYPFTVFAYFLTLFSLHRSKWFRISRIGRLFSKSLFPLLLYFIVLSVNFVATEETGMKTISDEALIVSTSQHLHFNREPFYIWRGYKFGATFTPVEAFLDKRPIAFSVLISFFHDIFGYRVENAYFLNLLLGLGCIALVGYLGFRMQGKIGAFLGMTLAASLPVLTTYSHGAGFDVFHVFMILVTMITAMHWYRDHCPWSMVAFVFSGILLCFSRYEAVMYSVPIGMLIAWKWMRDKKVQLPWMLLFAPVLMILVPLHQDVFKLNDRFWELGSIPEADSIFGFKYFYSNIAGAISFLWDTSDAFPNSPWVSSMGILSIVVLSSKLIANFKRIVVAHKESVIWILFLGFMAAHFILLMLYFYGKFDLGGMYRFALPVCFLAVLATLCLLNVLPKIWMKQLLCVCAFVGLVFYSIPVNAKHVYSNNYTYGIHAAWVGKFVERMEDDNVLVISYNPLLWTVEQIASIPFQKANTAPERLKFQLEKDGFSKILVVDRIMRNAETGEFEYPDPEKLEALVAGFTLKKCDEVHLTPLFKLRISELVDVDVAKVQEEVERIVGVNPIKLDFDTGVKRFQSVHDHNRGQAEFYFNLP